MQIKLNDTVFCDPYDVWVVVYIYIYTLFIMYCSVITCLIDDTVWCSYIINLSHLTSLSKYSW